MTLSATIWAFAPPLKVMQFPTPDLENPLSIGAVLDSCYRIVRLLGVGGLGRTYLATDSKRFDDRLQNLFIQGFFTRNFLISIFCNVMMACIQVIEIRLWQIL